MGVRLGGAGRQHGAAPHLRDRRGLRWVGFSGCRVAAPADPSCMSGLGGGKGKQVSEGGSKDKGGQAPSPEQPLLTALPAGCLGPQCLPSPSLMAWSIRGVTTAFHAPRPGRCPRNMGFAIQSALPTLTLLLGAGAPPHRLPNAQRAREPLLLQVPASPPILPQRASHQPLALSPLPCRDCPGPGGRWEKR